MLVLVTYDVNTESSAGRRRLAKVAKTCVAHGQRVQNSVFECHVDWAQFLQLQTLLKSIIDEDLDSLRFYVLGNKSSSKVIHVGQKQSIPIEGTLIV